MTTDAPSAKFLALAGSPAAELERLLASRPGPEPAALAGFEWRGANTPWYASLLGIRKFVKGFFDAGSGVEGYNIPVAQNAFEGPWLHLPSPEDPKRFGFYLVSMVDPKARDNRYPNAALLDYGASPRNFALRPERLLRDYLVVPDPADPSLLLGKAYLAIGTRVAVSYFALERLRKTSWRPS